MKLLKKSVYATRCPQKAESAAIEFNQGEIETEPEIGERWAASVEPYGDGMWVVVLRDSDGIELGTLPFTTELVFNQDGSLVSCKMS